MRSVNNSLYFTEVAPPYPGSGQVLVRVAAAGINRTDVYQLATPSILERKLGVELSGYITLVGDNVLDFEIGDRVAGFVYEGALAESVCCDARHLFHVPQRLSMSEGAGIPYCWFSALDALRHAGQFQKRDKVMVIISEYSDLAVALVQLAQTIGCRRVTAVCATEEQVTFILRNLKLLGALPDECRAILANGSEWVSRALREDPKGVQVVVNERGDQFDECVQVLSLGGRLVFQSPLAKLEGNLALALTKRITVSSTNIRASSPTHIAELCKFFKDRLADRFTSGKIKPYVQHILHWSDIEQAMELSRLCLAKIVCNVN